MQNNSLDLVVVPFEEEYIPELSRMLSSAYLVNNPVFLRLGTAEEDLANDFEANLRSRVYNVVLVFANKLKYLEGVMEIAACWCFGDLVDFLPPNGYDDNYEQAPTANKIITYMRYKAIQPIYEKFHPKRGELAYSGNFCLSPKYQGKGLTYQIYYLGYKTLLEKYGYRKYVSFAVNPIMQEHGRKSVFFSEVVTSDASEMRIQENDIKPFKDITLVCLPIDIEKTFQKLVDYLNNVYRASL